MLVFGDHVRRCDPRAALDELAGELVAIESEPPSLARHARIVGAFIAAGELAQGLADRAHPACDGRDAQGDAAMRVLVALAGAIDASWAAGFAAQLAPARACVAALAGLGGWPEQISARRAEGYAFYAVYPEAYLAAARRAVERSSPPCRPDHVIGIRSIGAGLAALISAVTGASLPSTVRPHGDPFARRIAVEPALLAEWTAAPRIAIADEGPGLSGSSFGAVLDVLEASGVALDRIACFPSHGNALSPAASEAHRARWARVARHVVDVDTLLLGDGTLARWIAELVGPVDPALEDLSAGAWRAACFASEAAWPAAIRAQERRKLRARGRGGSWLARFVGLGRDADRALARARQLHRAGFVPEPAGLCHGFLVERWLDSTPLSVALPTGDARRRLIDHVGGYLGFRARHLPAGPDRGASLARLAEMTARNTALGLGAPIAPPGAPAALEPRVHAVEIDGALHAHEWLVRGDGTIIKADALDHCAAHDLIGCQDIAWDIAGATAELSLSSDEQSRLIAVVGEASGRLVDPELLAFLRPCYLAFQLGRHALAATHDLAEAPRLVAAVERYAALLRE
jgi:hypothetical protein